MCGLFGIHKSHKITTNVELRNLNEQILSTNRNWLEGMVDLEDIDNCENLSDYIQNQAKIQINNYKRNILKVYEEVKANVKKRFTGFVNRMETTINNYINSIILKNDDDFGEFRKAYKQINKSLDDIDKKNKEKSVNLFEIFNTLKQMEGELKSTEALTKKFKFYHNQITSMNISVNYQKNYLNKLVSLNMKDLEIKKDLNFGNNSLLFKTISDDGNDDLLDKEIDNSLKINEDFDDYVQLDKSDLVSESEENFTLVRSKSLLKNQISNTNIKRYDTKYDNRAMHMRTFKEMPPRRYMNQSEHQNLRKMTINTYSGIERNIKPDKSFDISPVKKNLNQLNLYNPHSSIKLMPTNPRNKLKLKKMTTRDLSPSSIDYEFTSKNTVLNIKDRSIGPLEFRKIITDAFTKRKTVLKIVFKDNFFSFDVLAFLKEFYTKKLKKTICFDLRKNKMKKNPRLFDFYKKNLLLLNIKVLI